MSIEKDGPFEKDYFSVLSDAHFSSDKFKDEFNLIMKVLPPSSGDKVLDMGCGKGQLGKFFLDRVQGIDMTFSDVSSFAKESLGGLNFVQCSMTETSFKHNYFDKIYSLSTISHIEDIDKAIKEMYRISNGDILISTNNKWCVSLYRLLSFLKIIPEFQYDKTVKKLYNRFTLKSLLERNGWKIKKVIHYGKYPSSKLRIGFLKTRLLVVASK